MKPSVNQVISTVGDDGKLLFWCPGCDRTHGIQHGEGKGPRWDWNGDVRRPTITPSILVRRTKLTVSDEEAMTRAAAGEKELPHVETICHSFITDGRIQFLTDCTHTLAGQTVDLPNYGAGHD
ncbi:hypothetical protein SAMN05216428_102382 [Nitrosospira sp. Nsp11]|uniref:DUF6527 family protein n=1 Tax=Nitrosospira sp. Nsp11 TaxID=1855338 RepID=UPI000923AAA1|nr:DUF6527 family protein [Nitrosospira sp. Nsp11]SHL43010.1 hypothetical protein SAMN05216428_102382 [Nitrosospira sp. Nsp11]